MKTEQKLSLCKWVLLALIAICTATLPLIHLVDIKVFWFEDWWYSWFGNPFAIVWVTSYYLLAMLHLPLSLVTAFALLCSSGIAFAGWALMTKRRKIGRILLLIAFLPALILSALTLPFALLGWFFNEPFIFSFLPNPHASLYGFVTLAISAGAVFLIHLWKDSTSF